MVSIYTSQGKTMILAEANNACNWLALLFRISLTLFCYVILMHVETLMPVFLNIILSRAFKNSRELSIESIRLNF